MFIGGTIWPCMHLYSHVYIDNNMVSPLRLLLGTTGSLNLSMYIVFVNSVRIHMRESPWPHGIEETKHGFAAQMPNICIHSDPKTSQRISWPGDTNKCCDFWYSKEVGKATVKAISMNICSLNFAFSLAYETWIEWLVHNATLTNTAGASVPFHNLSWRFSRKLL